MMILGFVTIIVIEVSYVWQFFFRSAQNFLDVSFFVVQVVEFSWIYNQKGFPGSYSMCRMQRLTIPGWLMFSLNIIFQIFFQTSANGFRNLWEKQQGTMFFDFQGKKSCLGAEFDDPPGPLVQAGSIL